MYNFSQALIKIKEGKEVSREKWEGKYSILITKDFSGMNSFLYKKCNKYEDNNDYKIVWVPRQEDLMTDDWIIIETKSKKNVFKVNFYLSIQVTNSYCLEIESDLSERDLLSELKKDSYFLWEDKNKILIDSCSNNIEYPKVTSVKQLTGINHNVSDVDYVIGSDCDNTDAVINGNGQRQCLVG